MDTTIGYLAERLRQWWARARYRPRHSTPHTCPRCDRSRQLVAVYAAIA
jgi:hypothetical protein